MTANGIMPRLPSPTKIKTPAKMKEAEVEQATQSKPVIIEKTDGGVTVKCLPYWNTDRLRDTVKTISGDRIIVDLSNAGDNDVQTSKSFLVNLKYIMDRIYGHGKTIAVIVSGTETASCLNAIAQRVNKTGFGVTIEVLSSDAK